MPDHFAENGVKAALILCDLTTGSHHQTIRFGYVSRTIELSTLNATIPKRGGIRRGCDMNRLNAPNSDTRIPTEIV